MAKFLAMRIIENKTTFDKVPDALKEAVATILSEQGFSNLVAEGV
jgi:hypothetical protein